MSAPLSLDLRERIAAAHAARDGTNEEIAARFSVSRTTVERLGRRVREGVGLEPGKPTGRPRALQSQHIDWIGKTLGSVRTEVSTTQLSTLILRS